MIKLKSIFDNMNISVSEKEWVRDRKGEIKKAIIHKDDSYYISEKMATMIYRLRKSTMSLDYIIPDGYITRYEAMQKYNLSAYLVSQFEKKNPDSTIKLGKDSVLNEEKLSVFTQPFLDVKNYNNDSEWTNVSKIVNTRIRSSIFRYKKDPELYRMYYKDIYLNNRKVVFIKTDFLNEIKNGFNKKETIRGEYSKDVFDIKKIPEVLNSLDDKEYKNKRGGISVNQVCNITHLRMDEVMKDIENIDLAKTHIYKDEGIDYISYDVVERIMNRYGYYSVDKLVRKSGIPKSSLKNIVSEYLKGNISDYYQFNDRLFFEKDTHKELLIRYCKRNLDKLQDRTELLKRRLELFKNTYPITLKAISDYLKLKEEIPETNQYCKQINALDDLYSFLYDELYNLTDDEVEEIIKSLKKSYRAIACIFINYQRRVNINITKYKRQYGQTYLNQLEDDGKVENEKYIKYPPNIWREYYLILRNVDKHYSKAVDNYRYAQVWLYCLLNLSLSWRQKDIIKKFPCVALESIGIYNLNWFERNEITVDIARAVLEQIKYSLDGVVASKNHEQLHFCIALSLKKATAEAIIINEILRRQFNKTTLLFELSRRLPNIRDYSLLFNNSELIKFENLRCTKSILSYGFNYSCNKATNASMSYNISSFARSHKKGMDKLSNTTYIYLQTNDCQNGVKEYAYHIMEREGFGFLYFKIFQCILEQNVFDGITQESYTYLVKKIRKRISPQTLENMSNNLVDKDTVYSIEQLNNIFNINIKNIIKNKNKSLEDKLIELYKKQAKEIIGDSSLSEFIEKRYSAISSDITELKDADVKFADILDSIIESGSNCNTKYSDCIFSDIERYEKCPFTSEKREGESCAACKYNLHTTYMLYEIKEKLNAMFRYLEKSNSIDDIIIKKFSYMIKIYLTIIIEAKVDFDKTFPKYIDNIVDLKNIKNKIQELRSIDKLVNI